MEIGSSATPNSINSSSNAEKRVIKTEIPDDVPIGSHPDIQAPDSSVMPDNGPTGVKASRPSSEGISHLKDPSCGTGESPPPCRTLEERQALAKSAEEYFRSAAKFSQSSQLLVQDLVDGRINEDVFAERLQKSIRSAYVSMQWLPGLVRELRQGLLNGTISIEGINPPPPWLDVLPKLPKRDLTAMNAPPVTETPVAPKAPPQMTDRTIVPVAEVLRDAQAAAPGDSSGNNDPTAGGGQPDLEMVYTSPEADRASQRAESFTQAAHAFFTRFLVKYGHGHTATVPSVAVTLAQALVNGQINPYRFEQLAWQRLNCHGETLTEALSYALPYYRHALYNGRLQLPPLVAPPVAALAIPVYSPTAADRVDSMNLRREVVALKNSIRQQSVQGPQPPPPPPETRRYTISHAPVNSFAPPVQVQARQRPLQPRPDPLAPVPAANNFPGPVPGLFPPYSKFTYNCALCGEPFCSLPDNVMPSKEEWFDLHFKAESRDCIRRTGGNPYFGQSETMTIVEGGLAVEKAHCGLCKGREIDSGRMQAHIQAAHAHLLAGPNQSVTSQSGGQGSSQARAPMRASHMTSQGVSQYSMNPPTYQPLQSQNPGPSYSSGQAPRCQPSSAEQTYQYQQPNSMRRYSDSAAGISVHNVMDQCIEQNLRQSTTPGLDALLRTPPVAGTGGVRQQGWMGQAPSQQRSTAPDVKARLQARTMVNASSQRQPFNPMQQQMSQQPQATGRSTGPPMKHPSSSQVLAWQAAHRVQQMPVSSQETTFRHSPVANNSSHQPPPYDGTPVSEQRRYSAPQPVTATQPVPLAPPSSVAVLNTRIEPSAEETWKTSLNHAISSELRQMLVADSSITPTPMHVSPDATAMPESLSQPRDDLEVICGDPVVASSQSETGNPSSATPPGETPPVEASVNSDTSAALKLPEMESSPPETLETVNSVPKKRTLLVVTDVDMRKRLKVSDVVLVTPSPDGDTYLCKCGAVFDAIADLNAHCARHVEKAHVPPGSEKLHCAHASCGYLAENMDDFSRHWARHLLTQRLFRLDPTPDTDS